MFNLKKWLEQWLIESPEDNAVVSIKKMVRRLWFTQITAFILAMTIYFGFMKPLLDLTRDLLTSSAVTCVDYLDQDTSLPIISSHQLILPDGHYTIAGIRNTSLKVIQHLPGPDRNFVFIVPYFQPAGNATIPAIPQIGQRFTVFQGKIV